MQRLPAHWWVGGTEPPYAWLLGIGAFVSGTNHLLGMEGLGADRLERIPKLCLLAPVSSW